jgi:probable addiction module antidote protein
MGKARSYKKHLIERLKDPKEAASYINAALEDDDISIFLLALRDVAEAHGGIAKLAKETELDKNSLSRTLSLKVNPTIISLVFILDALGLELNVKPII